MWVISRLLINKMLGHAQRAYPRECFGVLSGVDNQMRHWHPLSNVEADNHRFLADSAEQIRLFKQLRAQGEEVLAIYHSHPQGPCEPSVLDLQQAYYPGVLSIIISLDTEGRLEMNGFLIHNEQVDKQELILCD